MSLQATATILEANDGRALSVSAGQATATREFFFIDFINEEEVVLDGFGQNPFSNPDSSTIVTPKVGDYHPLFRNLVAVKYSLTKVPGSLQHWRAVWTYENNRKRSANQGQDFSLGPEGIGFEEFNAATIAKPMLVYRFNPNLYGEVPAGEGSDIGGSPADAAAQPVTIFRRQFEITFSETLEAQDTKNIRQYSNATGMRGDFPDFDSGSVLYMGADISRVGIESYRVTHKYLWDQFKHAEQVPVYNAAGQCDLDNDGHVDTVRWVQPFKTSPFPLPGV